MTRLFVYHKAREALRSCEKVARAVESARPDLSDQLRRAAASIVLNTAEGANEFSAREKSRFYRMARRSAAECHAVLDALTDLGLVEEHTVAEARSGLAQTGALLSRTMEGIARRR